MKPASLIGVILIVGGALVFIYQGFSYTSREKVVDAGPIRITADRTRTVPLQPILGAVAVLAGVGLLVAGSRKS
ncbi:hypothetical protein [Geothrix sp. 21YS21S-2]|uniref:hypothetical protein n=1 Tax=Geothrix sp. 21YS21S-2 TaxID=3068893 RepID=UPI0027BA274F|nr:hypothetical protein [Geothrix sp. 21YS21S-2]